MSSKGFELANGNFTLKELLTNEHVDKGAMARIVVIDGESHYYLHYDSMAIEVDEMGFVTLKFSYQGKELFLNKTKIMLYPGSSLIWQDFHGLARVTFEDL